MTVLSCTKFSSNKF